jgi:hypothetical protein
MKAMPTRNPSAAGTIAIIALAFAGLISCRNTYSRQSSDSHALTPQPLGGYHCQEAPEGGLSRENFHYEATKSGAANAIYQMPAKGSSEGAIPISCARCDSSSAINPEGNSVLLSCVCGEKKPGTKGSQEYFVDVIANSDGQLRAERWVWEHSRDTMGAKSPLMRTTLKTLAYCERF